MSEVHDTEVWKDVVGHPRYEVSDHGRVKRKARFLIREGLKQKRQGIWKTRTVSERILTPHPAGGSVKIKPLFLRLDVPGGGRIGRPIHRLVLEAFVGPCPKGMECCHWDGNPQNNKLDNLRWDTKVANAADKRRHGTINIGARNGIAKLTDEQVTEIRSLVSSKKLMGKDIAKKFGVSDALVSLIKHRRIWTHLG